jgi:hypothetical protein
MQGRHSPHPDHSPRRQRPVGHGLGLLARFLLPALASGALQAAPVCVPVPAEAPVAQRCTEEQGRLRIQRSLSAGGELLDLRVLDAQGRLVRSETLSGGRRIKRVYYPDGARLRSETDLLERDPGAPAGREGVAREWTEEGLLVQETVWPGRDEHTLTQWHRSGALRLRQRSWRSGRDEWRTTETFQDSGLPASVNTERNGRLSGWQRYHDAAGRLWREDEHGERGVLLQRRHYQPDGTVGREERFVDDPTRL